MRCPAPKFRVCLKVFLLGKNFSSDLLLRVLVLGKTFLLLKVFVLGDKFSLDSLLRVSVLGKRFLLDSLLRVSPWAEGSCWMHSLSFPS